MAISPKVLSELPWSLFQQRMLLVQMAPHSANSAPRVQLRATQNTVILPDHAWVVRDDAWDHRCRAIGRRVAFVSAIVAKLDHDNGPIRDSERLVSGGRQFS